MTCARCGQPLSSDETGLSRKLINRGTTVFFCFRCLGEDFKLTREQLEDLIARFREAGCSLFR